MVARSLLTWLTNTSCFLLAVGICACKPSNQLPFTQPGDVTQYALLPMHAQVSDTAIRAAVNRIEADHSTPAALDHHFVAPTSTGTSSPRRRVEPTIVRELKRIFPAESREIFEKQMAKVFSTPELHFAPLSREGSRDLLRSGNVLRQDYRRLILTSTLDEVHPHAEGVGADTAYIHAIEIGNKLERLWCADLLEQGKPQVTIESVRTMLRSAQWLAAEKNPLPRLSGAQRRLEGLAMLRQVASHPATTMAAREELLEILHQTLRTWPPDADTWIGARAEGLYTYELVRDGYLLSLMNYEEMRWLRENVGIKELGVQVAKNIDIDELFYLNAMEEIIAASEKPYVTRLPLFASLDTRLEQSRGSDRYAFVADTLLLANIADGHRQLALDRARVEAHALALSLACGNVPEENMTNPLTGKPYPVSKTEDRIVVESIDGSDAESPIEFTIRTTSAADTTQ